MAKRLDKIFDEVIASNINFAHYLSQNIDIDTYTFLRTLTKITDVYIFSGVIRNFFLNFDVIRDLDIIIGKDVNLEKHFPEIEFKKNSFGGYKCTINDISIDLWTLEKTWALQYQKTINFDDLDKYIPSTAFFNFSAIVYSLNERKFYPARAFLSFLRDRKINYVYKPNANYALCVVNTLYYSNKYNLRVDDKLINFLKVLYRHSLDYSTVQLKHFGKILYTDDNIKNWIDRLQVRKKKKQFK